MIATILVLYADLNELSRMTRPDVCCLVSYQANMAMSFLIRVYQDLLQIVFTETHDGYWNKLSGRYGLICRHAFTDKHPALITIWAISL